MNMNVKIVKKKTKEYSHALNEVWTKLQSIESMETNNIKIDIVNAQSSLLHNKCKGWSYAIQCIYKMITIHVRMRIHKHQPLKSHKLSNQFNFFQNFLLKCLPSNPATEYLQWKWEVLTSLLWCNSTKQLLPQIGNSDMIFLCTNIQYFTVHLEILIMWFCTVIYIYNAIRIIDRH